VNPRWRYEPLPVESQRRNRRVRPAQSAPISRLRLRDAALEVLAWLAVVILGAVCAFVAAFI
jgi:hypothetical protein